MKSKVANKKFNGKLDDMQKVENNIKIKQKPKRTRQSKAKEESKEESKEDRNEGEEEEKEFNNGQSYESGQELDNEQLEQIKLTKNHKLLEGYNFKYTLGQGKKRLIECTK